MKNRVAGLVFAIIGIASILLFNHPVIYVVGGLLILFGLLALVLGDMR